MTAQRATTPVRERAYEYLKASILSGRFNPGERLTEERLAKELGISRTPIREALYKLESEGLITPLETRGFITTQDSKQEVEEIFEIRGVLEGYALRLIAPRISEHDLDELEGYVQQAEEALRAGSLEVVFQWNTRFHDYLHDLTKDRRRLLDMLVTLRRYVLRYRHNTLRYPEGRKRTVEGHRRILLARRLRDADLCERVMREHIQEAERDALQFLFEENEEV
jgi:DNA-binding GntR family transcriptional regulator